MEENIQLSNSVKDANCDPESETVDSLEVKQKEEFDSKIRTILEKLENLTPTASELKIEPISTDFEKVYTKLCKTLGVPINVSLTSNFDNEAIDLSYQGLGDMGIIPVAKALTLCKNAKELDLKYNKLGPKSLLAIALLLEQNENISRLNLSSNAFGKGSAPFWSKLIAVCHSVEHLDLSNNNLGDHELQEIGLATMKVDSIKVLSLRTNDFGGAKAAEFGAYMGRCSSLQRLDLGCCHLEEGAAGIFAGLKSSNLTRLDMSRNGIPSEAMPALATGLRASRSLKSLDISYNAITNKGATALAPGLKGSTTLETINLSHNPIQGSGASLLLNSIGGSLKVLDLSGVKVNLAFFKTLGSFRKTGKDVEVLFGADIRHDCLPRGLGIPTEDNLDESNVLSFLEQIAADKGVSLKSVLKDIHGNFISEQHAALAEAGNIDESQERVAMSTEELARSLSTSPLAVQRALALQIAELLSTEGFVDMWELIPRVKWKPDDLYVNIKEPAKPPPPAAKGKKK